MLWVRMKMTSVQVNGPLLAASVQYHQLNPSLRIFTARGEGFRPWAFCQNMTSVTGALNWGVAENHRSAPVLYLAVLATPVRLVVQVIVEPVILVTGFAVQPLVQSPRASGAGNSQPRVRCG